MAVGLKRGKRFRHLLKLEVGIEPAFSVASVEDSDTYCGYDGGGGGRGIGALQLAVAGMKGYATYMYCGWDGTHRSPPSLLWPGLRAKLLRWLGEVA